MLGLILFVGLQLPAAVICAVTSNGVAVADAEVVVRGTTYRTGPTGSVRIPVDAGVVDITVAREGFAVVTTSVVRSRMDSMSGL